ncbi:hypothetical protein [Mesorhizobium sp. 2RAF21]|uniref:hypothetical protein n=1 Tax=Mesorhizobium sp. 2RAF21 TaxID=3232995 RepID=UPI003F95F9FB
MAEVIRTESDNDHRYRITQTPRGFLLSVAQKGEIGLVMGPSEWLYKTTDAAEAGLEFIMLMNAWWGAINRSYPVGDLQQRCEQASAAHASIVGALRDEPLIGREVRELREQEDLMIER